MINKINDYIDSHKDNMINDLRKIMQIPSVNAPKKDNMPYGENVYKCLMEFLSLAKNHGFKTKNFDNYVGTIEYGDDAKLGILCHLDVVPEGTGWSVNPFDATVIEDKIYGRGAIDDKGPAIAVLYALKAVKELGIPLKNGVKFIVGCDEETGSTDLEYYKTKENFPPMVFTPDGSYPIINIEKGQCRVSFSAQIKQENVDKNILSVNGGKTLNAIPSTCTAKITGISKDEINKTIKNLNLDISFNITENDNIVTIDAIGNGAHASTPNMGANAVSGTIKLLANLPFDECERFSYIKTIDKLLPHNDYLGNNLGIACFDEKSKELTLCFSIFSLTENKISSSFDIRFPTCTTLEILKEKITSTLNQNGFEDVEIFGVNPHVTPQDSEFVKTLLQVYEEHTGLKGECLAIGGGTYVHDIEGGVAFGAEFEGQEHNMHSSDEFIEIDTLLKNAKIFAHSIVKLLS